ncbi:MAG: hypothetical protein ABIB71_03805 [Candidatus Woesearchaeota archaeon]
MKKLLLLPAIMIIMAAFAVATLEDSDYVLSNSDDWRDVYSSVQYATLSGKDFGFLVSEKHALSVVNTISRNLNIGLVSSDTSPFFMGYKSFLESKGFSTVSEDVLRNVNLELAERLPDITNFIIMDDSYGYNAIAAAPYAATKKSYVIFANRENIGAVEDFLDSKPAIGELLIFGHVDREVKEQLSRFNPEIINKEDRFDNNVEIVKRYREIRPAKQIVITNGEFIEKEIMMGAEPVLFIGRENVPDQIKNYIQSTDIEVAVLVGNELINTATNIRRTVGISTFVKFAQGSRGGGGSISQVEALDMFYLPTYTLNVAIESVKYNKAMNTLEVTYRNNADVASYLKGTITLEDKDSGEEQRVGDIDSVFIEGGSLKTIAYSGINLTGESFLARVFTIYGESRNSLEFVLQAELDVDVVNIYDNCEIELEKALFHKRKQQFLITVANIGPEACYVQLELTDVVIADERVTLGTVDPVKIEIGKKSDIAIDAMLTDSDLEKNNYINLIAYYGQRESSLIKVLKAKLQLEIKSVDIVYYSVWVGVILLIIVLLFLLFRRRKEDEEEED